MKNNNDMKRTNRIFLWSVSACILVLWGYFIFLGIALLGDTEMGLVSSGLYYHFSRSFFFVMLALSSFICVTDLIGAVRDVTMLDEDDE